MLRVQFPRVHRITHALFQSDIFAPNLFQIFTDRVRSTREGNVFSLFTPGGGGGGVPRPGPDRGGGTLARSVGGGYSPLDLVGGYPTLGTPSDLARGVPHLGYPCQNWLGGTPMGVPHLGYPPSDLAGGTQSGGYPPVRPGSGVP